MTKYARGILDIVNASRSHLTAEQIFWELKKTQPKVVLATVYNNLNALCAQKLIRRVHVEGSPGAASAPWSGASRWRTPCRRARSM